MVKRILVTGASSIIGQSLLPQLSQFQQHLLIVSRLPVEQQDCLLLAEGSRFAEGSQSVSCCQWDLLSQSLNVSQLPMLLDSTEQNTVIHCAPIWLLPEHIDDLVSLGVKRVVAFSSTSIDGKSNSSNVQELAIVERLRNAEIAVMDKAKQHDLDVTIFRPTLIYGYGQGANLAFIAKMIQRFGFFPVVTAATGLRRPVHADDLARAVCLSLYEPKSYQQTYVLSGREVFSYRQMVSKIFHAMGKPARILSLPLPVYRTVIALAVKFGNVPMNPAMADRMREHLDFDCSAAQQDFGYSPGPFLPNGLHDVLPVEESKK